MLKKRLNLIIIVFSINILINILVYKYNDAGSLSKNTKRNSENDFRLTKSETRHLNEFKDPIYYEDYFRHVRKNIDINIDLDDIFEKNFDNDSVKLIQKWKNEYKLSYNRTPPTNYEKWIQFSIDKKCPLHPNYYYQIHTDLMPFRNLSKTFNQEIIFKAYNLTTNVGLLELSKSYFNPINSSCNETNIKLLQLRKMLTDDLLSILPDKKFLLAYNYHDYPRIIPLDDAKIKNLYKIKKKKDNAFRYNNCYKRYYSRYKKNTGFFISNKDNRLTELLPIFSSCKTVCHKDILIPGYHHIKEASQNIFDDLIPWEKKLDRLVWRGATTGVGWRDITFKDDYHSFQRMRLVKWAMLNSKNKLPVDIDVGFISIANANNNAIIRDDLLNNYEFKDFLTYSDHFNSKYLMVIDGHSWVSRFQPFLFSKSLIFRSSYFVEWFSFLTRPWVHYLPVDLSFNDLEDNILWAHKNPEIAKSIAEKASKLAKKHLTFNGMQCYTGFLLLEYADLLKDL